jgi:5-methylcytosine-specific restriction endonuclease McrA
MPYKDYEEKKQREKERYARKMADPEKAKKYKEQTKKWKEENREKLNTKIRERKAKNKAYLIEMLGGKCVGCGVTENLQFDHIDRKQKTFTIGKRLESSLENKLIPEAKKCQLLCKSCHQVKTTINHDMHSLADGYSVVSVVKNDDEVTVTLRKLAQNP